MAYITGSFKHESGFLIEVLQYTDGEYSFNRGMGIDISADFINKFDLEELKSLGNFIIKTANDIEITFNDDGSKKAI